MNNQWTTVCNIEDLVDNSGVCALVNGNQIALFKVIEDEQTNLFAISNWDPFGKANVLYRGLIGSTEERVILASPLYKQRYCISSGQCLDDDSISLQTYDVRLEDNQVQLKLAS